MKHALYTPIDLSQPDALDDLFSLHRSIFGGHNMTLGATEGGDGAGADGGDAGGADGQQQQQHGGPGSDGDKPISEMTVEEKAAYFEKKANRLQTNLKGYADYATIKAERDALKASTQTDQEKAVAEAKAAGKSESDAAWATKLAATELRHALNGKTAEQVEALMAPLDLKKFLTETGEVDTEKVKQYAAGIQPGVQSDMGQGHRSGGAKSKGEDGRSEAEKRFGKKTTTA